jgi:uracil-DNA glycosylase
MTLIPLEQDLAPGQLFEDWRFKAREALVRGIPPEDADFQDPYDTTTLRVDFSPATAAPPLERTPHPEPHVPAAFLYAALTVARHSDPARWNLLYRLLWRLQDDSSLLHFDLDPDVMTLRRLEAEVPPITEEYPLLKKASQRVEYLVLRSADYGPSSRGRRRSR